jgi:hypothetical protein
MNLLSVLYGYGSCLSGLFVLIKCTHPQLRVCHKLTTKLKREVVLGSTSIDDPPQFITVIDFNSKFYLTVPPTSSYQWNMILSILWSKFYFVESNGVYDVT